MPTFFTVGHSTLTSDEFVALLTQQGVTRVVDVRRYPGSRRNPQFSKEALAGCLADRGIGYTHALALGGRRGLQPGVPRELNGYWQNESFHNYADYALTESFQRALDELIGAAQGQRVALMCSEAVWWRCHRRIIADHLLARGEEVFHIMASGTKPAALTPGARVLGSGGVSYPAAEPGGQ